VARGGYVLRGSNRFRQMDVAGAGRDSGRKASVVDRSVNASWSRLLMPIRGELSGGRFPAPASYMGFDENIILRTSCGSWRSGRQNSSSEGLMRMQSAPWRGIRRTGRCQESLRSSEAAPASEWR